MSLLSVNFMGLPLKNPIIAAAGPWCRDAAAMQKAIDGLTLPPDLALIDGNREAPVLQYKDRTIDPMKLVWSKVKAGEPCNVIEEYKKCLD